MNVKTYNNDDIGQDDVLDPTNYVLDERLHIRLSNKIKKIFQFRFNSFFSNLLFVK